MLFFEEVAIWPDAGVVEGVSAQVRWVAAVGLAAAAGLIGGSRAWH